MADSRTQTRTRDARTSRSERVTRRRVDLDDLDPHDRDDADRDADRYTDDVEARHERDVEPQRARRGRRPVRGTRMLLGTIATVLLVTGGGLAAYFTPLMSVRSIDVTGTSVLTRDEILAAANIATGTPLLQVDTRPAAQRIAAIPRVESVRVARGYPSTIDITVVERTPVAYSAESGGAAHLLDVNGVDFAQQKQAPALPRLTTDASDAADRAALGVVAGLPDFLRRQVVEISASSPADIRFTLRDRKTVVWGDGDRGPEKARTLRYLLTRAGTEFNVSAPENPVFR